MNYLLHFNSCILRNLVTCSLILGIIALEKHHASILRAEYEVSRSSHNSRINYNILKTLKCNVCRYFNFTPDFTVIKVTQNVTLCSVRVMFIPPRLF